MSKLSRRLQRLSMASAKTATMGANYAPQVPLWIGALIFVLALVMIGLQIYVTYYLYTLHTGDCTCAQGNDLLGLLVLSVISLSLSFVPHTGLQGLGMAVSIGFILVGYNYMKRIETCNCAKTMKGPETLQALVYIRMGLLLLGVLVIIGAMAVLGKLLWK